MMNSLEDDWLVKSLTMYDNVWMYELQDPTKCLSWMSDRELLVASCDDSKQRNEIMELVVPDTVFASAHRGQDKQMAGAKRDFTVRRGSFTDHPVHHVAVFPSRRMFATSGATSGDVQVWTAEDGKGTFTRPSTSALCSVSSGVPLIGAAPHSTRLLVGCSQNDVAVHDVSTGQRVWQRDGSCSSSTPVDEWRLSCLSWYEGDDVFFTCRLRSGDVSVVDVRLAAQSPAAIAVSRAPCSGCPAAVRCAGQSSCSGGHSADPIRGQLSADGSGAPAQSMSGPGGSRCRQHTAAFSSLSPSRLASCCSCGCLQLADVRRPPAAPAATSSMLSNVAGSARCATERGDRPVGCDACLQVQFSPTCDDLLSVSGLDDMVHIVSLKELEKCNHGKHGDVCPVVFSHDGHASNAGAGDVASPPLRVLRHSWHASERNLLFSAASDGSLHAWQPRLKVS